MHEVKELVTTLWSDLQRTRGYERVLVFCEGCAMVEHTLLSVWRQMRRTGLTPFEKLTYSALLLQIFGITLYLLLF